VRKRQGWIGRKGEKTKQDGKVSKITAKTGASGGELNREERRGCDTFEERSLSRNRSRSSVHLIHGTQYINFPDAFREQ
jgi:hypothetical protein